MQIEEDVLIKSIKLKNQQTTLKELYLVIEVDQNKWVGCVRSVPFGHTTLFQQFQTLSIPIKPSSKALICLWNYETVKKIKTVTIPTKIQDNPLTINLNPPNLQIQIYFEPKASNSKHLQNLQYSIKYPKFSLPTLKKRLSKRNSLKIKPQSENQTSAALYFSYQPSQNSLVYIENSSQNDTSLENIMAKDVEMKDYNFKGHDSKNQADSIKLLENKNCVKATNSKNLFDDYQARPKQISRRSIFESQKTKQAISKGKIANKFNSTQSSSTVKRNLQNVISILINKTQKGDTSQRSSLHVENQKNNSRQFFDYGLTQSKKTQQNLKLKHDNKNYQPINKQEKLQIFYQKHLTKKQIQKVARMTSFELSKSIFQQYGLDLSSTKIYSSKSFEKRKIFDSERQQNKQVKKSKNSAETRKGGKKKIKEKEKNEKNNSENKFQDYGECLLVKKARSSKSLRRMERPK